MIKKVVLLVSVLIFSISVFAQEISEGQKNLKQFVGFWKLDNADFMFGGQKVTGVYTFDCSSVCEGTGILAHEKFVSNEMGTLNGENLLGYDPNTEQIHLYSIDNTGTTHDHYGYWIDKHHLFVQYQGVIDGKMYVEQIDMKFSSPSELELNLVGMLNGEVISKAMGTYIKQ